MEEILVKKPISGIFNVGYGKSVSIEKIAETISILINKNVDLKSKNIVRQNEVMDLYADISKISNEFGWKPKYNINDGLADYIKND